MDFSYVAPLQRAWQRVERMLFHPFQIRTWFVLGFAAFLAEYLSGGAQARYGFRGHGHGAPHAIGHWARTMLETPALALVAVALGALALVCLIALQWVSCRGKFVFLDGVVRGRAAIVEPWKRFGRLGDSLFAWTLLFWISAGLAGLLACLPFIASLRSVWEEHEFHWGILASFAGLIAIAMPLILVGAFTLLFLNHFVVPIMYRHGLTVTAAWARFLVLLREHLWSFIGYGVIVFMLWVAVTGLVLFAGLSTCCVGFVLLMLPYVGQVVLLPVLAGFRALGPEFLAQYGPEYDAFALEPAAVSPAPTAPPADPAGTPPAGAPS